MPEFNTAEEDLALLRRLDAPALRETEEGCALIEVLVLMARNGMSREIQDCFDVMQGREERSEDMNGSSVSSSSEGLHDALMSIALREKLAEFRAMKF